MQASAPEFNAKVKIDNPLSKEKNILITLLEVHADCYRMIKSDQKLGKSLEKRNI